MDAESIMVFTSEEKRSDPNFVLQAVRKSWRALQFASPELRSDDVIVLEAVHQCWEAVRYATEASLAVMIEAVRQDWRAMHLFYVEELTEAELTVLASTNPHIVRMSSMKHSQQAWLTALRINGMLLKYAPLEMRSDHEVVMVAIGQNALAYQYVTPLLRQDEEIVTLASAAALAAECSAAESRDGGVSVVTRLGGGGGGGASNSSAGTPPMQERGNGFKRMPPSGALQPVLAPGSSANTASTHAAQVLPAPPTLLHTSPLTDTCPPQQASEGTPSSAILSAFSSAKELFGWTWTCESSEGSKADGI